MKNKLKPNAGGVNGLGFGTVNTNSADYRELQKQVMLHSSNRTDRDIIQHKIISAKLQLQEYVNNEESQPRIETGQFLKIFINSTGVKNKDFAKYLEIEESNLSAIIRGRRKITIELAYKLGELFDLDPNLWVVVQSKNDFLDIQKSQQKRSRKYKLNELLQKAG